MNHSPYQHVPRHVYICYLCIPHYNHLRLPLYIIATTITITSTITIFLFTIILDTINTTNTTIMATTSTTTFPFPSVPLQSSRASLYQHPKHQKSLPLRVPQHHH